MNRLIAILSACAFAALMPAASAAQTVDDQLKDRGFSATLDRLMISLPNGIASSKTVGQPLDELTREPCDQQAIAHLATALTGVGYRREAATALVGFSQTCGGHAASLRTAVNILIGLSDYTAAAAIASNLIKLEPFGDNGYFLRAYAEEKGESAKAAIDDYTTAIELFGNKDRISSVAYFGIARANESLGQFCDAVTAIRSWVGLNSTHDTSQTQTMIAADMARGNCAAIATGRKETFPAGSGTVVKLPVTINGVKGTFILDTGASFVSLTTKFAAKAKVSVDQASTIHLNTAHGLAEAHRGRADTVQVRSLEAKAVPIVVDADANAGLTGGVDGLLGMSFLSRFNLTINPQSIVISAR